MNQNDQGTIVILVVCLILLALLARRRWRPSTTAFGTACWASEKMLRAAGMFGNTGLILGRTLKRQADPGGELLPCSAGGRDGSRERRVDHHPQPAFVFPGVGGVFRHQGRFVRHVP